MRPFEVGIKYLPFILTTHVIVDFSYGGFGVLFGSLLAQVFFLGFVGFFHHNSKLVFFDDGHG